DEVLRRLKRMMSEELSEKVETVYADVYWIPLSSAIGLLGVEALASSVWGFVLWSRQGRRQHREPPRRRRPDRLGTKHQAKRRGAAAAALFGVLAVLLWGVGCDLHPDELFKRNSPKVDEAIQALDAGNAELAVDLLTEYLTTGKCEGGVIGAPNTVNEKPN